MAKIETLTAYRCEFSYMERNNPFIEEHRDAIREGRQPEYSFSNFIEDYTQSTSRMAVGEGSDRGIMLDCSNVENHQIDDNLQRWHIVPLAGKQGKRITVYNTTSASVNRYESDSAALYENHVFIYERHDLVIAVFHRQNGSGCKSVFLETANNMLKERGYKLEMNLITPLEGDLHDAIPTKLTLRYMRDDISTDIADNIGGRRKQKEIRNLVLNLKVAENNVVSRIIHAFKTGTIDKDAAFAEIRAEVCDEVYNDADIQVCIGGRPRTISWDDFGNALGSFDITERVHSQENRGRDMVEVLTEISDEYYESIVRDLEGMQPCQTQ